MSHAVHGHGAPVMRVEDERLVTGRGTYASDWNLPWQLYAHFVRADRAHAEIVAVKIDAALKHRGVKRVYTGADAVRAGLIPGIRMEDSPVPSASNVLGVKGVGESGCTASMPSLANAVMDALRPLGVQHLDMPMTPGKVWRAIQAAKATAQSSRR